MKCMKWNKREKLICVVYRLILFGFFLFYIVLAFIFRIFAITMIIFIYLFVCWFGQARVMWVHK
jgi:hypothetical protein